MSCFSEQKSKHGWVCYANIFFRLLLCSMFLKNGKFIVWFSFLWTICNVQWNTKGRFGISKRKGRMKHKPHSLSWYFLEIYLPRFLSQCIVPVTKMYEILCLPVGVEETSSKLTKTYMVMSWFWLAHIDCTWASGKPWAFPSKALGDAWEAQSSVLCDSPIKHLAKMRALNPRDQSMWFTSLMLYSLPILIEDQYSTHTTLRNVC